jgi:ribonuclease HI
LTTPIFHLAAQVDWLATTSQYQPPDFESDGFIHFSTAEQLDEVARTLYAERNDLVVLAVDPDALPSPPVYEDLNNSGEEFPHVYGPLPLEAVVWSRPYLRHLEEALWRRETRFDREWMDRFLHPDFDEFGASGKHHTRVDTLEVGDQPIDARLPLMGYRLELLSQEVALVRYVTQVTYGKVTERARRTSIWVASDGGWLLRFHQGTPIR